MSDRSHTVGTNQHPRQWRFAPAVWRGGRHVSRRQIDLLLRARSAAAIPGGAHRFVAMGIPSEIVEQTLRRVRSLDGWSDAWTWTAQRFLGEARQREGAGHDREAASSRREAALAYHAATVWTQDDVKKTRALRSTSVMLFAQATPVILPDAVRVDVRWRTRTLPGYLLRPTGVQRPALVVLLNGVTNAKEELVAWSDNFLARGIGVLALDWPGTGELDGLRPEGNTPCDDLTDGIFETAGAHGFDVDRIGLAGLGIGGALAVHIAAADRRVAACVAICPPFDATVWAAAIHPLMRRQLVWSGPDGNADELAAGYALPDVVPRMRAPVLVFGGGRDMVVPPGEAIRLASAAGAQGTLVWFPDGQHGLYGHIDAWTDDAARWLVEILGPHTNPDSTRVEFLPVTEQSVVARHSHGTRT